MHDARPSLSVRSCETRAELVVCGRAVMREACPSLLIFAVLSAFLRSGFRDTDSQNLCTVTEEKDLGVLIDNDLENHILSKIKTANRITGLVRRNFKNIDFPGFLLLYCLCCVKLEFIAQ